MSTQQLTNQQHNLQLLDPVRAPAGWGVFASDGPNYRHAIFGRDSIEVAEDLYEYDEPLARDIILTLARLQGTAHNSDTEEEPGKIHHEYRTVNFAGQPVPHESVAIMRRLQHEKKWDDASKDTMLYYGTYDATPLYIRLVQKYTEKYGEEMLKLTYLNKDGDKKTVTESVEAAINWLVATLNRRDDNLLAYRRSNPEGIENQVWKDSHTAYLFSDGTMPDHDKGVVSTELQGYAYDALIYSARFLPTRAEEFKQLAENVQRSTIEKLWLPEYQFFAQGIGFHSSGEERAIDTLTSNGALILDSTILDDLPEWARQMYAKGIKRMIMGLDFLTPAGIRCRAARHARLLQYVDYHGSYAVWAKETSDIARGLENHGYRMAALKLRWAVLDSFRRAGDCYELFYVDLDNTVYYDQDLAAMRFSSATIGEPLPIPEPGQAWSISAAIVSLRRTPKSSAQTALEVLLKFQHKYAPNLTQLFETAQNLLTRSIRRQ